MIGRRFKINFDVTPKEKPSDTMYIGYTRVLNYTRLPLYFILRPKCANNRAYWRTDTRVATRTAVLLLVPSTSTIPISTKYVA